MNTDQIKAGLTQAIDMLHTVPTALAPLDAVLTALEAGAEHLVTLAPAMPDAVREMRSALAAFTLASATLARETQKVVDAVSAERRGT